MKRNILVILCVISLYACVQKRPNVIERPIFDVWNSTTIEIDKIEILDTATIFHIDAFFTPNRWIRIATETYIKESGTDERLLITGAEGIELDEQTYMPASGTMSFKLFFPPLKRGITKIDFIESDCPTCFKIWGIHLLPSAKIKIDPVPKDIAKISAAPLPALEYSTQPAKISGKVMGYVDGAINNPNVNIYTRNLITGEDIEVEFAIAEDGSFNGEITPGIATIGSSSLGNLFFVPGEETKIYVDLKKRSRYQSRYRTDKEPSDSIYAYVSGSFTGFELDAINKATRGMFNDFEKLLSDVVDMKPEECKQYILNIMNKQIDELKQRNYSTNTQMMAENTVKLFAFSYLLSYEGLVRAAYLEVNQIKPEDRNKITFVPEKPDEGYYSFLKGQIPDNMMYLPDVSSLATQLARVFMLPDGKDKSAKERFAYFKEKASHVLGTNEGVLFDLVQAIHYRTQLDEMNFYTDAEKREIQDAFRNNPSYAEALIAQNDKMLALITANNDNKESILNELPAATQEKMFEAILANYKGKVVLVDFWATWCNPCMVAMKSILPMKEEMKEKNVVFLYLTGETSPLGTFMQTYPTISGEHYRVSDTQWNYWMNTFNIPGIPTYMVYDKQGRQISRHLGFPGVNTIKSDIEKGL